jgi:hypothetical protein
MSLNAYKNSIFGCFCVLFPYLTAAFCSCRATDITRHLSAARCARALLVFKTPRPRAEGGHFIPDGHSAVADMLPQLL